MPPVLCRSQTFTLCRVAEGEDQKEHVHESQIMAIAAGGSEVVSCIMSFSYEVLTHKSDSNLQNASLR